MLQNLSSAAIVIGALRVKIAAHNKFQLFEPALEILLLSHS